MIVDRHGRVADSLRISLTDRCDLRCSYCMPLEGNSFAPAEEVLTDEEIVAVASFLVRRTDLRHIRLTGGEPLLRAGLLDLVEGLAATGIEDLAMTTNAQLLAPRAAALKKVGLTRVNISLDTLKPGRFRKVARTGELHRTLDGIDAAIEAGLTPIKVNTVLIRGVNDDEIVDLVRYCAARAIELRFLELMAIGESASDHEAKYISTSEAVNRLAERFHLVPHDIVPGETSRRYTVSNGDGTKQTVGFISPVSDSFCGSCRRLRLGATGMLRGCLMNCDGPDLRSILRSGDPEWESLLEEKVSEAFYQKPWASDMTTAVMMHRLGG